MKMKNYGKNEHKVTFCSRMVYKKKHNNTIEIRQQNNTGSSRKDYK
jgi:hypothetical protein